MNKMDYKKVSLPQMAWHGDTLIHLQLPRKWDITVCNMAGHVTKALGKEEIQSALDSPMGTDSISELARGKRRVVIIFDDLHRPTPTSTIVSFILQELHKGGVTDDQISFVAATGAHRPMVREDFVKKLGEDIVEAYPIYTHNPFGTMSSLIQLGETIRGTPVEINREVAEADLKIGIGCIIPHSLAGFTGGAKIILPGCASVNTIRYNHEEVAGGKPGKFNPHPSTGIGKVGGNIARLDIEEAARMVGLDVKVDVVLNNRREIIGVFVGDFVMEHRAGVAFAKKMYATDVVTDADIVIANAYPLDSNPSIGLSVANASVREGGDVVLIGSSPEGIFLHYLAGRFGTKFQVPLPHTPAKQARKIFLLSKYLTKKDLITPPFDDPDHVVWCKSWNEILKELESVHNYNAKVAVYPYAGLQYIL